KHFTRSSSARTKRRALGLPAITHTHKADNSIWEKKGEQILFVGTARAVSLPPSIPKEAMIISEFTLMQAKLPSHLSHVMTTLPLVCFQTSIQTVNARPPFIQRTVSISLQSIYRPQHKKAIIRRTLRRQIMLLFVELYQVALLWIVPPSP
ncbi:transmembrane protein, putative, partial [Bodo saltans]